MPRAYLQFKLPAEREEYDCAVNGSKYRSVLWDLDQALRNDAKHGSGVNQEYAQFWRDKLWELMKDEGVEL